VKHPNQYRLLSLFHQAKSLCSFNDLLCSLIANFRVLFSTLADFQKCVEVEDKMSAIKNRFSSRLNFAQEEEGAGHDEDSR
jgi:hypothetical protein